MLAPKAEVSTVPVEGPKERIPPGGAPIRSFSGRIGLLLLRRRCLYDKGLTPGDRVTPWLVPSNPPLEPTMSLRDKMICIFVSAHRHPLGRRGHDKCDGSCRSAPDRKTSISSIPTVGMS